jgi:outer membrane protein, multidrug efflux system
MTLFRFGHRTHEQRHCGSLPAQRSCYSAQQNLITARLLEANNLITLYSVLGGGWR